MGKSIAEINADSAFNRSALMDMGRTAMEYVTSASLATVLGISPAEAMTKRELAAKNADAKKAEANAAAEIERQKTERDRLALEGKKLDAGTKKAANETAERTSYVAPAIAGATAVVGAIAGAYMKHRAGVVGSVAVKAAEALGEQAGKLVKAKGLLAGTPKGDAMKGIIKEVEAATAKPSALSTVGKNALPVASTAMGLSSLAYARWGTDDPARQDLFTRMGYGELGLATGLKLGGVLGPKLPQVSAAARASVVAGKERLAREAAGGAKASAHRIEAEIAGAKKQLNAAHADVKIGAVKGEKAVASAAKAPKERPAAASLPKISPAEQRARKEAASKAAETRRANALREKRSIAARHAHEVRRAKQVGTAAEIAAAKRSQASKYGHRLRKIKGQGVHAGGRGYANPAVQAAVQARRAKLSLVH
jgi:hypothetical protein